MIQNTISTVLHVDLKRELVNFIGITHSQNVTLQFEYFILWKIEMEHVEHFVSLRCAFTSFTGEIFSPLTMKDVAD